MMRVRGEQLEAMEQSLAAEDDRPRADEAPAPGGPSPVVQPCPLCPEMEIQFHRPPDWDDRGLVLLKCERPAHHPTTRCRIRVVAGAGAASTTVVLVNPDGRLRFPESGDTTRTLAVPSDGRWVEFAISGEHGSDRLSDTLIEARCRTSSGRVVATAKITVVWFDEPQLVVNRGGRYRMFTRGSDTHYAVPFDQAVRMIARATIRPAGVDCGAPMIAGLRVAMVQNTLPGPQGSVTWSNPKIWWRDGVPTGTVVTVWASVRDSFDNPQTSVDGYDPAMRTSAAELPLPLFGRDPEGRTIPEGCAGHRAATGCDTPGVVRPTSFVLTARHAGRDVALVTYTVSAASRTCQFITWTVIWNEADSHVCALRERRWSIDADSARDPVYADPGTRSTAPTVDPVLDEPTTNRLLNWSAHLTFDGTVTFTSP